MCRISVIIPVYNAEKTLNRALDSLLRQDFEDFEVILVDDGSADSSLQILEGYALSDSRFSVIKKENGGPSSARNAGIEKARGDYLYFVDADDYIEDHALSALERAASDSGADTVVCGFYDDGPKGRKEHVFPYEPGLYEGEGARKIALDLVGNHSFQFIPPYSVIRLIKRELLENPPLRFDEKVKRSEDYLFSTELHFRLNKLCLITDQPLYHYVDNADSITNTYLQAYWGMAREIYFRLSEKLPEEAAVRTGLYAMLIYRSLIALNNAARAGDKAVFDEDAGEILHDPLLLEAARALSWRDGFGRFGPYFILLRLRLLGLIKMRYYRKYRSGQKSD